MRWNATKKWKITTKVWKINKKVYDAITLQTSKKNASTKNVRFFAVIDLIAIRDLTKSTEKNAKNELVDIDLIKKRWATSKMLIVDCCNQTNCCNQMNDCQLLSRNRLLINDRWRNRRKTIEAKSNDWKVRWSARRKIKIWWNCN